MRYDLRAAEETGHGAGHGPVRPDNPGGAGNLLPTAPLTSDLVWRGRKRQPSPAPAAAARDFMDRNEGTDTGPSPDTAGPIPAEAAGDAGRPLVLGHDQEEEAVGGSPFLRNASLFIVVFWIGILTVLLVL